MTAPGPSWLSVFGSDDQAQFFAEMRDAVGTSAARRDPEPLETCLREWKVTARELADSRLREALARDQFRNDDFAEVTCPGMHD